MSKSGSMSSQCGAGRARIDRVLAMILCLLMLMGLLPAQALAALADGETVTVVVAPAQAEYTVNAGTALADVGLPGELTVTVSTPPAEEGGEAGTRTEAAAVEWTGDYDKDKPGSYPLTASFTTDGYSFEGAMPTVTVTVQAAVIAPESKSVPEAASFVLEKLNIDESDQDNDLADVPDFYEPVLEKAEDTETALFSFTDRKDTVQYRIYGTCGKLTGFFACKQDGSAPDTDDVVDEDDDRALMPVVETARESVVAKEPVKEAAKECSCDPKPGEGEAHKEGCPLYVAPETVKVCTCDPKPGEGEAHEEGCPLYVAPEIVKVCSCDPKPGEGEAHKEGCPLYVAPEAAKGFLSEKADAFVLAADKLDKDAILAVVTAYKAARDAAEEKPDDADLKKVAETANEAVAAATAPVDEALALYDEVPEDELDTEQVAAAYAKLTEIVTAVQTAMNAQPILMGAPGGSTRGTIGGTASKLDGDWAYLETFALLDDPATTGAVEGIQDGAGPFDTSDDPDSMSYKNRQGNDENAQNGKVRSFDTITYKLNYSTATSGEYDYVKEGWMEYKMALPYPATEAVWQTDSMTWVGTKVADQAGLDGIDEQTSGYYLTTETIGGVTNQVLRGKFWLAPNETNPYAIPGEGTLSAVVQVLAMEENDTVQPTFTAWMAHNSVDPATCSTHNRAEVKTFTAPVTDVTAEVRLDIEVMGSALNTLSSVNFNVGDTDAPNKGKGTLTGKAEAYSIGVYLWNGTLDGKGRKGLMAPKSGDTMTFDLTLDAAVVPNGGATISIKDTAYAPLLWAAGSNDTMTDWRGRSTLTSSNYEPALAANTAFGQYQRGNDACYDGGEWSYIVDPSDPKIIHVTISSMEIDLTNFPEWNMARTYSYTTSGGIPISSGQLQLLQPVVLADGTHIMEDTSITGSAMGSGDIWTSVKDNNMQYTYVSKTDNQSYTLTNDDQTKLTDDDAVLTFYAEKASGWFDNHVVWTSAPTSSDLVWYENEGRLGDTTGGAYYLNIGGDPTVRNQNIGAWFGAMRNNDIPGDNGMVVAGKCLLKFDSAAVVPTGNISYLTTTISGFSRTVLYATKADGSAWTSDDEMEQTSMKSLKYYESLDNIPAGHECIGVLVEYLPNDDAYTGMNLKDQYLYADAGLKVKDTAVEGSLYQCTVEVYLWNKGAYENASKNIPSLLDSTATFNEAYIHHWQPTYDKGTLNQRNGHLEGATAGPRYGDVMQIIAARSIITKKVAQRENGVGKSVFYMDSDQRFVDYKLNVSTEYVTNGVVTQPENVITTLTISDAMPNGIVYVPNSAYYGGTYTQNPVPGRQGTVTGGTPLALKDSWVDGGFTWYKFEIPNVTVGVPLEPVYLTAKIGTRGVEATDVTDGQHIRNNALSQVGKEITTEHDDVSLNQGFAEIVIAKNTAVSRSKLADKSYIESTGNFAWTINVGNNGGSTMPNALLLDVFPYIGDGHGTKYTGTLSLTEWNVDVSVVSNFSNSNWKIMYTTDINVRGTKSSQYADDVQNLKNGDACGPNDVVFTDLTSLSGASVDWDRGIVTLPEGFAPTAIVMVGALLGSETMRVKAEMEITNSKQGDILVNQLDGYPSPIYTVERAIEGCTWIDANKDGIRQDSETMLPGVTATLLKLKAGGDATVEADYEPVKDGNNVVVSVQTGKQKNAATGTETTYEPGRYQFTNFGPGTYAVRFTSGDTLIDNYTASPVNRGLDESRDSDATPTYNAAGDKLLQTLILGIVMAEADDTMRDIKQISRNNDSGLYLDQFALTVSKTVTQGSQTRDFTFTVYLANGTTPLTGTFNYTGSAITGVTAPSNGSITLTGGSATITLKHGQSISIAGIPAGTNYSVTEAEPGTGWTPVPGNRIIGGTLNAPATAAFSNSYAVLPGTYTAPAVTKTLSGALHTGFNATFSATIAAVSTTAAGQTAATMPMPGTTTVTTPAFTATGTQNFAAFGNINYTLAGQYVYRITEETVSAAGVTRDQSEYTLTVDVADVNGQLTATPVIKKTKDASGSTVTPAETVTGAINFANSYAPATATVAVVTPAKALRVTEGNALPNNYSETFAATIAAKTTGAPMPAHNSVSTGAFTAAGNQNFAAFGSITFTAPGTYEYTIKESIPTTVTPGMTYDKSEYELSVVVADNGGQLAATLTYTRVKNAAGAIVNETATGITFENTYAPTAATLASGAITVKKTLTGAVLPTAKAFSFTLTHNATAEGPAAGVALRAPTTISTTAVTQGTNIPTTANFGVITFNRVGTYTFTVTETASGITNMTDAAPQTVTVAVTDTNGVLSAAITSGGTPPSGALTFTNDYQPIPATLQLGVTKTLTIDAPLTQLPSASTFTFALTHQPTTEGPAANVTMPDPATVTTASMQTSGSAPKVTFGNISFNRVGTYTFQVAEQDPGIPGMTLPAAQTITVAVTDTNGTLTATVTAPASGKDLSFTNLYSPPPAEVPITVIKRIVGAGAKLPVNATFIFDLAKVATGSYEGVTMPASLTVTTESMNTGSATPVSFGNIEFMQEGTFVFTVSERATNIHGMTDAASQTVRIKTEIHGTAPNEVMSYEFVDAAGNTVQTGGTLTFDNTYEPTAAEITDAQLNVKKAIGGVGTTLPAAETFTFTLARTDNGAANAVTMPTGAGLTATTAAIATGTSAAVGFGPITFHAAGTYTFSITETPGSIPRLTYAGPQTVTVKVTDQNGELTAAIVKSVTDSQPASGALTFQNNYVPTEAKLTSADLNVEKTVAGHILPTATAFTFTLSRTDGGDPDAVALSAPTSITTEAIRFGDAAVIGFGDIIFKAAGTYTFSVAETASGITGMTDAAAQTVTVRVTDTNGVLSAAITSGGTPPSGELTFTNTYMPQSVTPAALAVQKIVDGAFTPSTAETFTFVLTPISYTAPNGWTNPMTPAQMPVPAAKEITISGSGTKSFGTYNYTMAGTYVYIVSERAGTNPDYTYDKAFYSYMDVVTDNNGVLTNTRTMTKPGVAANQPTAVFTNTYTRPMGQLTVRKTVSGGGDPNALFTLRFTFSEATRYDYVKSDLTTGTIATGESLALKHGESVTVTIHQGVTYTVVEDAYMAYVPTPASRTFSGTISAAESAAAYVNRFDAPYIPPDPTLTGNLTVQKKVTGDRGDRYKDFAFKIEFNDAGSYYYTGSKSGMITSGDTILLRHKEYITIINLPAGTKYSVTESGNSGYRVYASGDVGIISANSVSIASFTNSRSKVPPTGDDGSVLKGLMLMLISLVGGTALVLAEQRLRRRRRRSRTVR